jgi:hypothetical protein
MSRPTSRVIHLHPAAPPKPKVGAVCNGCGVCCAWSPCPLGLLLTRRAGTACVALHWDGTAYRCGVLMGRHLRWLPRWIVRRWIAAGVGCDSNLQVT